MSPGQGSNPDRSIIKFTGTHLYTWVERGTVRVKCLTQGHNAMFPTEAQTLTARSKDEHNKHESTMPSISVTPAWSEAAPCYLPPPPPTPPFPQTLFQQKTSILLLWQSFFSSDPAFPIYVTVNCSLQVLRFALVVELC